MLYPTDSYFVKANTFLDLGISANPRMCHELFVQHIMKFKDDILAQDDKVFMEYCEDKGKRDELAEEQKDLMKQYNVKMDVVDTIMERCGMYWKQLEDEQRETIWKYLKVLIVLAERV